MTLKETIRAFVLRLLGVELELTELRQQVEQLETIVGAHSTVLSIRGEQIEGIKHRLAIVEEALESFSTDDMGPQQLSGEPTINFGDRDMGKVTVNDIPHFTEPDVMSESAELYQNGVIIGVVDPRSATTLAVDGLVVVNGDVFQLVHVGTDTSGNRTDPPVVSIKETFVDVVGPKSLSGSPTIAIEQ